MPSKRYFTPATFKFLRDLAENNDRKWFQANKDRYEKELREPALHFITDFGPHLARISSHFRADPRPMGGSLFRIYRDTRFSKDKSPYKTYSGIQFRHELGKDAHAPGFYFHIQPGELFAGVGSWHPDSHAIKKIRDAIAADPAAWKRASRAKRFTDRFALAGDSLKRPPRGFDPEHAMIDDLKRKDFIGIYRLNAKTVTSTGFLKEFTDICKAGAPFMKFLCKAVGVPF